MCGITGFIDYQNTIGEEILIAASTTLRHRGGDGYGHIYEKHERYNVGLANERLATIDTSTSGIQPFTSLCGNYTITFNGTIYNYLDLRASLIKYGVAFNTLSDTEVLIECYKKWGHQLFEKIDGAFAFAILDRTKKQLFLARDSMGVKPLYYYKDKNFFVFGSELKALLQYPIARETNIKALEQYLKNGYFIGSETIFQQIYSFKKQHYFIIDLNSGNFLEHQFETNNIEFEGILENETQIVEKLDDLLTESILRRNVADVNVGVMLSGGYDSATVAAILQKNQAKKLRTFTLGFENKKFDEAPAAKEIANYLHTNHSEYYINNAGAIEMLERLPDIFDEPMGDSGAVPLAFLASKIAKEDIKVVLGAEGGDELFAGYKNYQRAIWLYRKSKNMPKIFKKTLINLSKTRKNKLRDVLFADSLTGTYQALTDYYSSIEINQLLKREVVSAQKKVSGETIKSLLDFDLNNYLPNDLLLKSDRITMHFGIDNRDALLKTDLVHFTEKLDDKWFIKDNQLKYLLKKVSQKYIPQRLMDRPKKGFSIPLVEWLNGIYKPYLEQYLSPENLDKHRFFDIIEVFKIKNRFYNNPNNTDARKLWLLLQFQMWYNRYIG
ncbi:asparagine synthase (glutamine-hydrolyzing) [Nubsella zeaxanthinifaciens]|jgi:asparagine synthase (glutamine-hydrolysing)|uniref:asparagine synthase (glutamine-hydrolyzing) n=1 Tax=Nubsella zeaxanthinifaciens TaxID=392412 RepID=UPI000DE4B793|nr:asparagine synthase (glutamine-hydrolyzing) [Nubsella zeaxanthinifaciens]